MAKDLLRRHEGLRTRVYQCTAGKNTVGYGRNLDDRGITVDEAELLLHNDVMATIVELARYPYWSNLDEARRAVLIDLMFCVGPTGYAKFVKMNRALTEGDYDRAAAEIMDSLFAQQTGNRATELAQIIKEGLNV